MHEDDFGPFTKMKVELHDGPIFIRWGLDRYTYQYMRRVVHSHLKGTESSANYRCFLDIDGGTNRVPDGHVSTLTCQLGTQWIRLEFPCSDLFLSNLEWLRAVESTQELQSVAWDRWIETDYDILYVSDLPPECDELAAAAETSEQHKANKLRKVLPVMVVLIAFVVLFAMAMVANHYGRGAASSLDVLSLPTAQGYTKGNERAVADTRSKTRPKPMSRVPQTLHEIYEVPRGDVALTFDDGPSPYTERIVQELNQYQVHATFFFIGYNVRRWPDAVRTVAANGNVIGDHTLNHPNLATLSADQQKSEILGDVEEINRYVSTPVVLFRPPYDVFNHTTEAILEQHHMVMALWNRDPKDWAATSPEQVVRNMFNNSASGGLFDLHDTKNTMLALPVILKTLQSQHLKLVVLSASQN